MIARHLLIRGKVQGVFYRAWTQHNARALGLTGWVRNLADGNVEALVQGEPAQVEELVRRCWQGPRNATVRDIRVEDVEPEPNSDFQVRSALS